MRRRMLIGLAVLPLAGCLLGCKSQTTENWQQSMEAAKLAIDAAKASGLSAVAIVEHDGTVSAGQDIRFYLDTGFDIRVIVTGDLDRPGAASAECQCVPPVPEVSP